MSHRAHRLGHWIFAAVHDTLGSPVCADRPTPKDRPRRLSRHNFPSPMLAGFGDLSVVWLGLMTSSGAVTALSRWPRWQHSVLIFGPNASGHSH